MEHLSQLSLSVAAQSASISSIEATKTGLASVVEQLHSTLAATESAVREASSVTAALTAALESKAYLQAKRDALMATIVAERDAEAKRATDAAAAVTEERERRLTGRADPTYADASASLAAAQAEYSAVCVASGGWTIIELSPSTVTLRYEHPATFAMLPRSAAPAAPSAMTVVVVDRATRLVQSSTYTPTQATAPRASEGNGDYGAMALYTASAIRLSDALLSIPSASGNVTAAITAPSLLLHVSRNLRSAEELCRGIGAARCAAGGVGVRIEQQPGGWCIALDMSHGLSPHTPKGPGLKLRILLQLNHPILAGVEPWPIKVRML